MDSRIFFILELSNVDQIVAANFSLRAFSFINDIKNAD